MVEGVQEKTAALPLQSERGPEKENVGGQKTQEARVFSNDTGFLCEQQPGYSAVTKRLPSGYQAVTKLLHCCQDPASTAGRS